ncbi:DinI-like family protein [Rahnella sp. FC061912-K]|uniref:DinI-like family protein n=1 Tax=Rahnella rivi TaxID=2816249 RepID=UPI001C280C6B|nr:DinI-like family protein [Rahnella rivi]MBU9830459.1 DinI-like family protein [Rahnella rivi]
MFVELIYDKRNMAGVPNANALILAELTKRVHGTFPDADVKVKPMVTLSSINTNASKARKAVLAGIVEEMFLCTQIGDGKPKYSLRELPEWV